MSKEEQLKEIARRERIRDYATKRTEGAYGVFQEIITGGGWLGTNFDKETKERETNYLKAMYQIIGKTDSSAMNENEYEQFYENVKPENKDTSKFDDLNPKNDKKWWNPTTWFKADGGELPEFFIGGLFKAVKNVVSGVVNTVSNVAKTVWNGVSSVAANPLVSTIASFIPGANIIVPAINAVNALGSGNIMGAAMNALGGISNFANINTVNAINSPTWLQNLRFSKFGQGVANMYHGAVNTVANIGNKVNGFFDMARNSTIGKIGMQVFNGNIGGAIGTIVGRMPGLSGGIENFGNWLKENKLEGILGAVPGIGGLASKVPNILSIPGMESILGRPGEGFSALGALSGVADRVGMKGVYQAILSGAQTGNYIEGLPELAAEMGVDPRVLGVLDKGKALLQNNKFNAEYAMQTAIEFLPVPLIVEKIVAAPTPVPINSGDTYLVAPSSTNNR